MLFAGRPRGPRAGARAASLALAFAAAALVLALAAPPTTRAGEEKRICPIGQTIVLLKDGVDPDEAARAFARRYSGVVCRVYRHSCRGVTLRCTGPAVVRSLAVDPLVRSVEPDVMVMALGDPPGQALPPGVARVLASAQPSAPGEDGRGVGVAIVDTGIDLAHPDLDVAGAVSFVEGAGPSDDNGHGTHCAGIVAARDNAIGVVGVAPAARLFAVKVLDKDGAGALSDVVAGLDWVVRNADRVAVANLSLGVIGKSPSLRAAIQACVHAGVVVVVAAGNEGADVFGEDGIFGTEDDHIPAAYPEVLAVSAMAESDGRPGGLGPTLRGTLDDSLAGFSNHSARAHDHPLVRGPGGAIDLAAPGVDILSCWKEGGYRRASGTSMAAPHVTGLVARFVGAHGRDVNGDGRVDERDVYAVRQALIDAAEPQTAWRRDGATGDPDGLHEGLARAVAPARRAAPAPAPAPPPTLADIAGVRVIGVAAPTWQGRLDERAAILVGVKNGAAHAATFEVVVIDRRSGRGLGRARVDGLAPGAVRTLAFPAGAAFDPTAELRSVILPERRAR